MNSPLCFLCEMTTTVWYALQDLAALPSMEELEESVEVTFNSAMFAQDTDLALGLGDTSALAKLAAATAGRTRFMRSICIPLSLTSILYCIIGMF